MARELSILVTARNMASGVLKDVKGDIKGIQSEARRGLQNTARNLTFIGGAAAAGLGTLVVKSVQDASNLQQAMGAVDSVFGDSAATIKAWGEQAAESAGLSKREVAEMGAVVGAQLQGMGFDADKAAEMTVDLEKRAADLAATFGGTTTEAIESISSLLRGERDPIEKYGVSIKQADVNARVLAMGLDTSTTEAKKNAEATAALSLLMEQTAKTQGQFARETDSAAGSQQRLRANLENVRATIGDALLPQVAKLTDRLNDAAIEHMPEIEAFAAQLPGIFDDLLGIVENLPWGAIGDAMSLMGQGAKAALDLFSNMPDWVQTAVLTGWGLNKLTGGALGNIVGQLGSGLIKGVLGMTAGVVNINAATVNGGIPGVGGKGGAPVGGGGPGLAGGLALAAGVGLSAVAVKTAIDFDSQRNQQQQDLAGIIRDMPTNTAERTAESIARVKLQLDPQGLNPLEKILFETNVKPVLEDGLADLQQIQQQQARAMEAGNVDAQREARETRNSVINEFRTGRAEQQQRAAQRASEAATAATSDRAMLQSAATQAQHLSTISGIESGNSGKLSGILAKKSSVNVDVNVTNQISIQEWQRVTVSNLRATTGSGGFI